MGGRRVPEMDEGKGERVSDTESIVLNAIRSALAGLDEKTPLPDYDEAGFTATSRLAAGSTWENFAANFRAVNGRPMESVEELTVFLKAGAHHHGYCDPQLRDEVGLVLEDAGLEVEYTYERTRYNDYAFGVTRASGIIGETGTVILNDHDTSDRLAALSPWVHVAVLKGSGGEHRTVSDALRALGDCPNVIWATGPSKTADVEGILIEGVHGPGEQICLRVAE